MRSARPLDAPGAAPAGDAAAAASSYQVATTTDFPYTATGRIFFKRRRLKGFCSGVAVDTPSRRVVLTAGHCLLGREGYARHPEATTFLIFVPAYADGAAPYGRFVMESSRLLAPWRRTENPNFDVAAVVTYPNEAGQAVADATGGGVGVAVDQPADQQFRIVGYPGYNQQHMKECDGPFIGLNPLTNQLSGNSQLRAGCFLQPGSSGGPWFVGEPPLVDGVTSMALRLHINDRSLTTAYFSSETVGALLEGL